MRPEPGDRTGHLARVESLAFPNTMGVDIALKIQLCFLLLCVRGWLATRPDQ